MASLTAASLAAASITSSVTSLNRLAGLPRRTCNGPYASDCTMSIKPSLQQLENRDEGHRDAAPALLGLEQADEIDERRSRSGRQHVRHALAHRQRLALYVMMREHVAAGQNLLEGEQHFLQRDLRRNAHHFTVDELGGRHPGVALQTRDAVDAFGRPLEALVFLQPAHELGTRIGFLRVRRSAPAAAACAT